MREDERGLDEGQLGRLRQAAEELRRAAEELPFPLAAAVEKVARFLLKQSDWTTRKDYLENAVRALVPYLVAVLLGCRLQRPLPEAVATDILHFLMQPSAGLWSALLKKLMDQERSGLGRPLVDQLGRIVPEVLPGDPPRSIYEWLDAFSHVRNTGVHGALSGDDEYYARPVLRYALILAEACRIPQLRGWTLVGFKDARVWHGTGTHALSSAPEEITSPDDPDSARVGLRIGEHTIPLSLVVALPYPGSAQRACFVYSRRRKKFAEMVDYARGDRQDSSVALDILKREFPREALPAFDFKDRSARRRDDLMAAASEHASRPWVLTKVAHFMEHCPSGGAIHVTGPAGSGKSVLMAQLARLHGEHVFFFAADHFAEDAAEYFLRALVGDKAPLIPRLEYAAAVRETLSKATKRIVLVLDGIDNVLGGAAKIRQLFPSPWPEQLFVIVSSRSEAAVAAWADSPPRVHVDLSAENLDARNDVVAFAVRAGLFAADAHEYARVRRHNFHAVWADLQLHRPGSSGDGSFEQACDEVLLKLSGDALHEARELFVLLATARDSVSVDDLRAAGIGKHLEVEPFLERLHRVLARTNVEGEPRMRIGHPSFEAWLTSRRLGDRLAHAHSRWAELAPMASDERPYRLEHAPRHLLAAGSPSRAAALLCDVRFIVQRLDEGMLGAHLSDIEYLLATERAKTLPSLTRSELARVEAFRSFLLAEADLLWSADWHVLVQRALEPGAPAEVAETMCAFVAQTPVDKLALDVRTVAGAPPVLVRISCDGPIRAIVPSVGQPSQLVVVDATGLKLCDLGCREPLAAARLDEEVSAIIATADGVLYGTAQGSVGAWSCRQGELAPVFRADAGPITALAAADGALYVATRRGVLLRREPDGQSTQVFVDERGAPIVSIALKRSEVMVVSSDGRVHAIGREPPHGVRALAGIGRAIQCAASEADGTGVVLVTQRGDVLLLEPPSGVESLGKLDEEVSSIAGRAGEVVVGTLDGAVLHFGEEGKRGLASEADEVLAIALLPGGRVAFGGEDGELRVVRTTAAVGSEYLSNVVGAELLADDLVTLHEDGALVAWTRNAGARELAHHAAGGHVLLADDGAGVISLGGDGWPRLVRDAEDVRELDLGGPVELAQVSGALLSSYARDARRLRVTELETGRRWDHDAPPDLCALLPGEHGSLLGLTRGERAVIWNLLEGRCEELPAFATGRTTAFAHVALRTFVLGYDDGRLIELSADGKNAATHADLSGSVRAICSCRGSTWAALDEAGRLAVYAEHTLLDVWSTTHDRPAGRPLAALGLIAERQGKLLVVHADGISRWTLDGKNIFSRAFTSPSRAVALAGGQVVVAHADGSVRWLELEHGQERAAWFGRAPCWFLRAHAGGVWAVEEGGRVHQLAGFGSGPGSSESEG